MTTKTIYRRVFAPFFIALVVATGTAYLIATYLVTQSLDSRLRNQVEHALTLLSSGTFPLTLDLLRQFSDLQEMHFFLANSDGELVVSTLALAEADHAALLEQVKNQLSTESKTLEFDNYLLMSVDIPITRSQQFRKAFALTTTDHVSAASRDIALTLSGITLMTLLVLTIWGHRASRALTEPIDRLVLWAGEIAKGHRENAAVTTDITELSDLADALAAMSEALAQFEQELANTHRLKGLGELAAQVAHEIRNPLTAIKLQIQLLSEDGALPHSAAQPLLEEIQRLELIVNGTLSLARPISANLQNQSLADPVQDVVKLVRPQLQHRGINLDLSTQNKAAAAIDADRVKQVVYNLLNNAANALPEGGQIVLSVTDQQTRVILTVEDSGPGVTGEHAQQLFAGNVPSSTGLGIGLMICKGIMDLHQGEITYAISKELGGACFTLSFPKH